MFVSGRVILEEVHAFTIPHTATLSPFYRRNSGLCECLVKKIWYGFLLFWHAWNYETSSSPFTEEGHGAGCKACKAQIDRTAIDQCQECNPGYQLRADGSCHPFQCTQTGAGQPCKACRAQKDRRADNQCAECNPGFRLGPETFMCIPHRCNEGSGSACKKCASSQEAAYDGQCLEPLHCWEFPSVSLMNFQHMIVEDTILCTVDYVH